MCVCVFEFFPWILPVMSSKVQSFLWTECVIEPFKYFLAFFSMCNVTIIDYKFLVEKLPVINILQERFSSSDQSMENF